MTKVLRILPKLIPALLLGLVATIVAPMLLQWLGLSGPESYGLVLGITIGVPVLGAVGILLSRILARRRAAGVPPNRSTDVGATLAPTRDSSAPTTITAQEDTMTAAGPWDLTISTPIGKQKGTFDFSVEEAALAGTANVLGGTVPITDGSIDGNAMKFTITVTNPMKMDLIFDVVADGDTLAGTVKAGPMGEQKVVGERA